MVSMLKSDLFLSKTVTLTVPLSSLTGPGARFSKASETFRARKAMFSSSAVSKNGEVYTPETSCRKGTSLHIKNM